MMTKPAAVPDHRKRIYIVSHSSMDLASVLFLYDKYRNDSDVRIVISSTAENLQFLQSVRLPEGVLRYCSFASIHVRGKSRIVEYVEQLFVEKRLLDGLIAEIRSSRDNELFFHSYDNDPHFAYVVAKVSRTNRVTLVDVLGIRPKPLWVSDLLTMTGLKNVAYLAIMNLVFGRLFVLSGTRSYPMLSLNLKRVRIATELPRAKENSLALARYKHRLTGQGKIAVLLYANAFGIGEQHHVSIHRSVVECLLRNGFEVHVKMHPQCGWPEFLENYPVAPIPKHVPFELVELCNVALVVGITGAALLCTDGVPTVSMVKLIYESGSDYFHAAMTQLRQNPAIIFVSSLQELDKMLDSARLGVASNVQDVQGSVHGSA